MKTNVVLNHKTCGRLIKLSDDAICTYIALKSLYNQQMEIQYLSIKSIIYQITKEITTKTKRNSPNLFESFEKGLRELENEKYIKILENDKDFYLIDMSNLYTITSDSRSEKSFFTMIDLDIIREIYKKSNRKNIFKFLCYFLFCKHENDEMYYFNKTREEIKAEIEMDIRTIDKYLDILEKVNLIYVYRFNFKWIDSGKQIPNAYGLAENKDIIEENCNQFYRENSDKMYLSKTGKKQDIEETVVEENKTHIYDWKADMEQFKNSKILNDDFMMLPDDYEEDFPF